MRAPLVQTPAIKGSATQCLLPIYLLNGMSQSDQIAARRCCSTTDRVPGKFGLVNLYEEIGLSPQTCNCCRIELFFRHTTLYWLWGK